LRIALRSAAVKSLDPKVSRNVGETEFDVEVTERGSVTLRPVVVIPRDDAWAYTAEHLADVARALADIREGRVRQRSDDDLAAYDDRPGS
jgi:hypothetical protein